MWHMGIHSHDVSYYSSLTWQLFSNLPAGLNSSPSIPPSLCMLVRRRYESSNIRSLRQLVSLHRRRSAKLMSWFSLLFHAVIYLNSSLISNTLASTWSSSADIVCSTVIETQDTGVMHDMNAVCYRFSLFVLLTVSRVTLITFAHSVTFSFVHRMVYADCQEMNTSSPQNVSLYDIMKCPPEQHSEVMYNHVYPVYLTSPCLQSPITSPVIWPLLCH